MNWITDYLAVGDIGDLDDVRYLRKLRTIPVDVRDLFAEHVHLENTDADIAVESWDVNWEALDQFVSDLEQHEGEQKVMIHCSAGIDRSPFVAAYYLFKKGDWTIDEAYAYVKNKRPQTFIHVEWMNQALDWKTSLETPKKTKKVKKDVDSDSK